MSRLCGATNKARSENGEPEVRRRQKLTPHHRQEALARRAAGEALVEIARSYAVRHLTISRLD
jgi:hypothetical protein